MLKSEVQHQFWLTKKAVQRKLGSKEDECIVSSDAELDAKIELFKSISDSCGRLFRIIDQYQERLCILAQEESALGKFLKEMSRTSHTSGKIMSTAGKSISYCGQQRLTIRPSLLRLSHEVEVFRYRAIADTQATIVAMEKERTEYRASLSWMKSASSQLDPDTGRGLEKFRRSQTHVRLTKTKFDRLSLDCLEKIDLLAAARCNMFSHALVSYMSALLQFALKSAEIFTATAQALAINPQYNFCVLKDLTDAITSDDETCSTNLPITPLDSDQMLFFLDEYTDEKKQNENTGTDNIKQEAAASNKNLEICNNTAITPTADLFGKLINIENSKTLNDNSQSDSLINLTTTIDDLISASSKITSHVPSNICINAKSENLEEVTSTSKENDSKTILKTELQNKNSLLSFLTHDQKSTNENCEQKNIISQTKLQEKSGRKDASTWFHLFSELDPLANPDVLARKIDGGKSNSQTA